MEKSIGILFISLILFSCNNASRSKINNIENNKKTETMDNYLISERKEIEVFSQVLNSFSYNIDKDSFTHKLKRYLSSSSIKKQNKSSLYTSIMINETVLEFSFSEQGRYIKQGEELLPEEELIVNKLIADGSEDGTYAKNFVSLNKVLFNDDAKAIKYLIANNPDLVKDIVVLLNYEQDDNMIICAINNLSAKEYPSYFFECIIFYNNEKGVRSHLLSQISKYDPLLVKTLFDFIQANKTEIKKEKILIDNALALLNEMQSNKDRYAIIDDADGYTNLRKGKNTSSEIIQKIETGEEIGVINNSDNWYLVKTKYGNQGYIHKSKIKREF